ncbi:hypothetical protein [Spiroplasma cantharicola]|uniref:Uncharacterized protein n=1 Tax=Spiroplasma cantharicola TaxID=362837 RepID=A0A0M5KC98_9MOLU|nr:hypothetical protein [Spiroplasma cantharicola]ALD66363.1 hypothetical protein SCANT_v1c04570 [Spiroplasma cantharicola]
MNSKEIWMIRHKGDNNKNMFHPFLILYISNKRVLALQFSSIDIHGNSYYGKFRNNNLFDIITSNSFNGVHANSEKVILTNVEGMEYQSLGDPKILYSFYLENLNEYNCKYKTLLTDYQFRIICQQIPNQGWEKEIKDLIDNIEY